MTFTPTGALFPYICIYMYMHMYVCTYIYTHIYICVCGCLCVGVCVHMYGMHTTTFTQMYKPNMHIHEYIHINAQTHPCTITL